MVLVGVLSEPVSLAEQLTKEYGNIIALHRYAKLGSGALREAFSVALKSLDAGVVLEMDAGLSRDPAYIPILVKELGEGFDVAVGSRYVKGCGINSRSATRRQLVRWLTSWLEN
jgi:dolichol-phosphate mannosyltransferase